MKTTKISKTILNLVLVAAFSFKGMAQFTPGGVVAGFGVDADTKANYAKKGSPTGSVVNDDWFSLAAGTGRSVIDTSNISSYRASLMANQNITFTKGMSVPVYSRVGGRLWIDAVYSRDYTTVPGSADSVDRTAFVTTLGNTNGDDLTNWTAGVNATLPEKNDFVDGFLHMRRNGNTINDSLWLFGAVSCVGNLGERHLDIELLKNTVTLNSSTGLFTSAGPDAGHVQWLFDASGNITQTGDLIITVSYASDGTITTGIRIWVAKTTYNTVVPSKFNFGANFNGKPGVFSYGYANILSKTGTSNFGAAVGNVSLVSLADSTYSTPWGTRTIPFGLSPQWSANYNTLQFVETGVNLSRIGLDPALYTGMGTAECDAMFRTILFKSRAANSFTAALQDFIGPLPFMVTPVLDHSIINDTLACNKTVGTLRAISNSTGGLFQWETPSGTMVTGTSFGVNRTGRYILHSSIASGCAVGKRDTLMVIADSLLPVASASVGANGMGQTQLFGGNVAASNYATPFGGSEGLTFSWTGPNSFTSTTQNPIIGTMDTGTYSLTVREVRNGCPRSASVYYNFSLLASKNLLLNGTVSGARTILTWKKATANDAGTYILEKRTAGNTFVKIAAVNAAHEQQFSYTDVDGSYADKAYRVKMINSNGAVYFSNTVAVNNTQSENEPVQLTRNPEGTSVIVTIKSKKEQSGYIAVYNVNGALQSRQQVTVNTGSNSFKINNYNVKPNSLQIITVSLGNEMIFSDKLLH